MNSPRRQPEFLIVPKPSITGLQLPYLQCEATIQSPDSLVSRAHDLPAGV